MLAARLARNRRSPNRDQAAQMAERELIAAIITTGILPTLPIPRSRGPITDAEGETIQRAVGHAIGLYRSILEGLGVDPLAGLPGHDTPRQ